MALVLVQHIISEQIVELPEEQLAHPVLGPLYQRVRVNKNGKVFILKPGETVVDDPDEVELPEVPELLEVPENKDAK